MSLWLPVKSHPGRVVKLRDGDESFEVLAKGESRCCTYETNIVVVRAGRFVALLAYGHLGAADESERALVRAAVTDTARRLAALEATRASS